MYKYPFREQMLIYAQRPDATACASLELWNEKMNCWVNKGAQGIALIDEEGVHRSGLKYVFDVKDVHEARFIGHKPKLWKMEEEHKDYVIDSLERIYGETDARKRECSIKRRPPWPVRSRKRSVRHLRTGYSEIPRGELLLRQSIMSCSIPQDRGNMTDHTLSSRA